MPTGSSMKLIKLQQSASGSANLELSQVMKDLGQGKFRNVVFFVGAGISTAAGIPDFRTPGTGLYSNLARLALPYAEAVFDIDYLRERPQAFYTLAKELFPGQFEPTDFHYFMKWVADQGYLKRIYTQNIDTLERIAGIDAKYIVEAHGSFASSHCIDCHQEVPTATVREVIMQNTDEVRVPRCPACEGVVKPDIVFFGENLPSRFFEMLQADLRKGSSRSSSNSNVDLVIVAGTSLQVHPFATLPNMLGDSVVRVLLNTEQVGGIGEKARDVVALGHLETISEIIPGTAAASILAARKVPGKGVGCLQASRAVDAPLGGIVTEVLPDRRSDSEPPEDSSSSGDGSYHESRPLERVADALGSLVLESKQETSYGALTLEKDTNSRPSEAAGSTKSVGSDSVGVTSVAGDAGSENEAKAVDVAASRMQPFK